MTANTACSRLFIHASQKTPAAASANGHPRARRAKEKCADLTPDSSASGSSAAIAGAAISRTAHDPIHQAELGVLSTATARTIASAGNSGKTYPGSLFWAAEKKIRPNTTQMIRNRTRSSL